MKTNLDLLNKENEILSNEIDYQKFQVKLLTDHVKNIKKIIEKQVKPAKTFRLWQFYSGIKKLVKKIIKNPTNFSKYYHLLTKKTPKKLRKKIALIIDTSKVSIDRYADYQIWLNKHFLHHRLIDKIYIGLLRKKPLFSLIIDTNSLQPKLISTIIKSITDQSYKKWEVIIVMNKKNLQIIDNNKNFYGDDNKIKFFIGNIFDKNLLDQIQGDFTALIETEIYLWPNILLEAAKLINKKPWTKFIYFDEDAINTKLRHFNPFFKPDWSPDYLKSTNYIGQLALINSQQFKKLFKLSKPINNYDVYLQITTELEKNFNCHPLNNSNPISHISKIAFSQFMKKNTERNIWHVEYPIKDKPLVSIIVPTKNQYYFITECLNSIIKKSTYRNYELVIIDTGSSNELTFDFFNEIKKRVHKIKILSWSGRFNFSDVCNYGADQSEGDYLLFLNNDTKIITPNWIQEMLGQAQRKNIGAVGCKMIYPNNFLQHAGVILGIRDGVINRGVAGHVFKRYDERQLKKYRHFYNVIKNYSAVTAACMMISKEKFKLVGGFDSNFRIAFNDIDLCLKLLSKNLYNLYTPYAKLYHYESVSIGRPEFGERDVVEFKREINLMFKKWGYLLDHDPFYNQNYSLFRANFSL